MATQHQIDEEPIVNYWLGPEWEGVSDNNPVRLFFVIALQSKEFMPLGFNEKALLHAARLADGNTETD